MDEYNKQSDLCILFKSAEDNYLELKLDADDESSQGISTIRFYDYKILKGDVNRIGCWWLYDTLKKRGREYILLYNLSNGKNFSVYVTEEGIVTNMIYDLDNLVKSDIYYEINEGMTYEEVLKLVPNAILVTNYSKILNEEQMMIERPFCELIFSDGTYSQIFFENNNGNYKVVEKGELFDMVNQIVK